jgi:hypothetical protein
MGNGLTDLRRKNTILILNFFCRFIELAPSGRKTVFEKPSPWGLDAAGTDDDADGCSNVIDGVLNILFNTLQVLKLLAIIILPIIIMIYVQYTCNIKIIFHNNVT